MTAEGETNGGNVLSLPIFQARFSALPAIGKSRLAARQIGLITIDTRDRYFTSPTDAEALYQSSELIHRIANYVVFVLSDVERADADYDRSFAERIFEMAVAQGASRTINLFRYLVAEEEA